MQGDHVQMILIQPTQTLKTVFDGDIACQDPIIHMNYA